MTTSLRLWGWDRFFEELLRLLQTAGRESESANTAFCEYVIERLGIAIVSCSTLLTEINNRTVGSEDKEEIYEFYDGELRNVVENLRQINQEWVLRRDQHDQQVSMSPPLIHAPRGRPKFDISKEQLEYLKSMDFTWTQIAELLGVSLMTIYRRRREFGMLGQAATNISDEELRTILNQMRRDLPSVGETIAWGHIRGLGIKITRQRLRDAIHDTDPLHTALRWRGQLANRRPYSVAGPNSLWHIGKPSYNIPEIFQV